MSAYDDILAKSVIGDNPKKQRSETSWNVVGNAEKWTREEPLWPVARWPIYRISYRNGRGRDGRSVPCDGHKAGARNRRKGITLPQDEPSAQTPWTRTTFVFHSIVSPYFA